MTMTSYEFDATNWRAKSETRNTVSVSLSTYEKAQEARQLLLDSGFACGTIKIAVIDTDVSVAVGAAKLLLR